MIPLHPNDACLACHWSLKSGVEISWEFVHSTEVINRNLYSFPMSGSGRHEIGTDGFQSSAHYDTNTFDEIVIFQHHDQASCSLQT